MWSLSPVKENGYENTSIGKTEEEHTSTCGFIDHSTTAERLKEDRPKSGYSFGTYCSSIALLLAILMLTPLVTVYASVTPLLTGVIQETSLKIDIAKVGSSPSASQIQDVLMLIVEESERQKKDATNNINTLAEDVQKYPKGIPASCISLLAMKQQDGPVDDIISKIITNSESEPPITTAMVNVVFESIASMQGVNLVSDRIQAETGSDTDPEKIKEAIKGVAITAEDEGGRGDGQNVMSQMASMEPGTQKSKKIAHAVSNIAEQEETGNELGASSFTEEIAAEIGNGKDIEDEAMNARTDGTLLDDTFTESNDNILEDPGLETVQPDEDSSSGNEVEDSSSGNEVEDSSSGNDGEDSSSGNDGEDSSSGNDGEDSSSGNDGEDSGGGGEGSESDGGDGET